MERVLWELDFQWIVTIGYVQLCSARGFIVNKANNINMNGVNSQLQCSKKANWNHCCIIVDSWTFSPCDGLARASLDAPPSLQLCHYTPTISTGFYGGDQVKDRRILAELCELNLFNNVEMRETYHDTQCLTCREQPQAETDRDNCCWRSLYKGTSS